MSDLNLLPSQAKFQAEKIRLKKIINDFLWIFGGFWFLFVIIIFLIGFVLQLNSNRLNNNYQKSLNKYKTLLGDMVINQKIKYQAKIVGKVLGDRFEYGESMEMVKNIFSKNIIIENFEMKKTKEFIIEGKVADGNVLDEVESKVRDINNGRVEGFKSAEILSLKIDETKGWSFNMEVILE